MLDLNVVAQDIVLTLLGTILTIAGAFLAKFLKNLAAKAGISLSAQKQALLDSTVQDLILRIEEESAARIRAGLPRIPGGEKFEQVLIDVVDKIPGLSRTDAEQIIQANLPKIGVGALANQVKAGK